MVADLPIPVLVLVEQFEAFAVDAFLVLRAYQRRIDAGEVVVEAYAGVSARAAVICEVQLSAGVGEPAGEHVLCTSADGVSLGAPDRSDGLGELMPHA